MQGENGSGGFTASILGEGRSCWESDIELTHCQTFTA